MQESDRARDRPERPCEPIGEALLGCRCANGQIVGPKLLQGLRCNWVGPSTASPIDSGVDESDALKAFGLAGRVPACGELSLERGRGDEIRSKPMPLDRIQNILWELRPEWIDLF